jgi:septum formation inhibitor-activating ATPase MinD
MADSMSIMASDQDAWDPVHCTDPAGRERGVHISIRRDPPRVVLTAPPGETAVLSMGESAKLRGVLARAERAASKRQDKGKR